MNRNYDITKKAEIDKDLYVSRCEHHYILCLKRTDKKPRIIGFFHEKMDVIARVKSRL